MSPSTASTSPVVNRAELFLFITIVLWSVSPTALVESAGAVPSDVAPSIAILLATGLLILFYSLKDWGVVREAFRVVSGRTATRKHIALLGTLSFLGFVLYPWCYMHAFDGSVAAQHQTPPDLAAPFIVNAINYLWPCFAVLFGIILFREYVPLQNVVGVALAFFGALLAVSSTIGFKPALLDHIFEGAYPSTPTSLFVSSGSTYLFALAGAVSWGLYTAMISAWNFKLKSGGQLRSSAFYLALLLFAVPIHIFYLASHVRHSFAVNYHLSMDKAAFFLVYVVGSLVIAHSLFVFVRRSTDLKLTAISAATYLVFAAGTVLLAVVSTPVLSPPITAGFALILTGMLLARDGRVMSPVSAFIIFSVVSFGLASFFAPPAAVKDQLAKYNDFYLSFQNTMTAVFGILAGFTLNRAIARNSNQESHFFSLIQHSSQVARHFSAASAESSIVREFFESVERLYVERYLSRREATARLAEQSAAVEESLEQLQQIVESISDPETRRELVSAVDQSRRSLTHWEESHLQKITTYEWLVLLSLVITMSVIGYRVDTGEQLFRIARSAFNSAIIVVLFAIADFDSGRPSASYAFLRSAVSSLPPAYRSTSDSSRRVLAPSLIGEGIVVIAVILVSIVGLTR